MSFNQLFFQYSTLRNARFYAQFYPFTSVMLKSEVVVFQANATLTQIQQVAPEQ